MKTKKSLRPIILIIFLLITIFTSIHAEEKGNKKVTYIPGELTVPSETHTFYVGESIDLPDPEIDTPVWTELTSTCDPECSPCDPPSGSESSSVSPRLRDTRLNISWYSARCRFIMLFSD